MNIGLVRKNKNAFQNLPHPAKQKTPPPKIRRRGFVTTTKRMVQQFLKLNIKSAGVATLVLHV
jgi:hypothetical protein